MPEATETIQMKEQPAITPSNGSVGLETQVAGQATTVSNAANATGGVGAGNFIEQDLDAELFAFKGDDTPLMQLMLKAKTVNVNSPEVEHYMIDEPKSSVTTNKAVEESTSSSSFSLPLDGTEQNIPQEYGTLLVKGVSGYDEQGKNATPGKDLMLFVTGRDSDGNPVCRAVNGKRMVGSTFCSVPAIPANTEIVILSNALYETQKEVAPDLIVPQPREVYLQKRGMNQIVSDYFESQKKHIRSRKHSSLNKPSLILRHVVIVHFGQVARASLPLTYLNWERRRFIALKAFVGSLCVNCSIQASGPLKRL